MLTDRAPNLYVDFMENTNAVCPICGRESDRPYRRVAPNGAGQEGCIASFHNASMQYDAWHMRKEARAWRKATKM